MKHTHKNQEQLLANLSVRENSYIFGPTGSGKSRGVKEASETLKLPFYKKLVGNQTSEVSILGYMDAGGRYVEGIAYKPFTEGGVLLIDEIDNGNPNTNLVINGLSDGEISFPCGMREKHPDFCLVATANTTGNGATLEYCGRNRIDGALLNRFVFIKWPYDTELEKNIGLEEYKTHGGTDESKFMIGFNDILKLRQVIEELKIPHIISPRSTLQVARKLAKDRPMIEILQGILFKGLDIDAVNKIKQKAQNTRFLSMGIGEEVEQVIKKMTKEEKKTILMPHVQEFIDEERKKMEALLEQNKKRQMEEKSEIEKIQEAMRKLAEYKDTKKGTHIPYDTIGNHQVENMNPFDKF